MKPLTTAGLVGLLLMLSAAVLGAQAHGEKPAAPAAKPHAAPPAAVAKPPAVANPAPRPSRGPIIAPSKPVVAPGIAPHGDSGAMPTGARSANARTVSVSARQAAEQTIAALVAAMKNLPKRPPAPPESRTPRAKRAGAGAEALHAPPPILYRVTWPAAPPELGVDRRVELEWSGESAGTSRLHWND